MYGAISMVIKHLESMLRFHLSTGHEGKAGMAAIVLKEGATLDFHALYRHVASSLPDYARPKFLRLVQELETTGTHKLKKTDLVKKGFAPDENSEVYVINPSHETYIPLTDDFVKKITTGQSKLWRRIQFV